MPPSATRKKKPVAPVPPEPAPPPAPLAAAPPSPAPGGLPVVYDRLEIVEHSTTSPAGPLDATWWKRVLKWETESQYQERKVKEEIERGNVNAKKEHFLFGDGVVVELPDGTKYVHPVHCRNVAGEKVVCWANANNRPFDEGWCEQLIHTILYGQWAGPFTVPGETVNCETVRISRYGRTISGQHEGTACILADEHLKKQRAAGNDSPDKPLYPAWKGRPSVFIETIVCKGCSEDPRVLMTVDYVKPRTAADVFYTSDTFKDANPVQRKELCRNLANALDLTWTRTGAKGYRTHPEVVGFLDRHNRLLRAVEHIYANNDKRQLSQLRLQPGTCSALMYLMGCSATPTDDPARFDANAYRNSEPPTEKDLDWSLWDKAEDFWTLLATGDDFQQVRDALAYLLDSSTDDPTNQGQGGRGPEKLAILAKAWERWRDHPATAGPPFDDDDLAPGELLSLSYNDLDDKGNKLPGGMLKLLDIADFGGIDCPPKTDAAAFPDRPMVSPEEMAEIQRAAAARHAAGK